MDDSAQGPNKAIIGIIVVVLLVVAATAVIIVSNNTKTTTTSDATASISPSTSPSASSATASTSSVKDGMYSASGSYQTPGGQESIGVKVTLAGGVITDATVTQNASGGEAEEYQSKFLSGYKSQVVGKKISDVSLTRVAGSSLTPIGFNNAIDSIESQAQS